MKRNLFSLLALILLSAFASVGNYSEASAQHCCSYTVIIDGKIPDKCFPITLSTWWDIGVWSSTYSAPGTYTVTPNSGPFVPCPSNYVDRLRVASVNNFGDVVFPNECGCNIDGATGCKLRICTSNKSGCWVFTVSYCD
jgi:hypothetical protein